MENTPFPSAEEIVDALNGPHYTEEDGVDLGGSFRGYRGPGFVELKMGTGRGMNVVQKEFEIPSEERAETPITETGGILGISDFIISDKGYKFPTIIEAVEACVEEILELESKGAYGITSAKPW